MRGLFRPVLVICLVVFVSCMATPAQAELLRVHDPAITGNGNAPQDGYNITYDTETDLSWLDPTLSTDLSYNTVLSELGPLGLFPGYHHASYDDLLTLFLNAELSFGQSIPADPDIAPFQALLGVTGTNQYPDRTLIRCAGFYDRNVSGNQYAGGVYLNMYDPGDGYVSMATLGAPPDQSFSGFGHWLIIPEPSTLTLLAMGAVGLLTYGWRRRRREA